MSQQPVPETRLAPWSGQLRGLLFGLAPDGVFRALAITHEAVGSYPAFSPLPLTHRLQRRYFLCGTFRQRGLATAPPACIPPAQAWVTRHRALWSSDFPPRAEAQSDSPPFQDRPLVCQLFCRFQGYDRRSVARDRVWLGPGPHTLRSGRRRSADPTA